MYTSASVTRKSNNTASARLFILLLVGESFNYIPLLVRLNSV